MTFYVWNKDKVEVMYPGGAGCYPYCYVYDSEDSYEPWGRIVKHLWETKDADDVPKEFRLALLIMGISTK